jgi:hypothetical protein
MTVQITSEWNLRLETSLKQGESVNLPCYKSLIMHIDGENTTMDLAPKFPCRQRGIGFLADHE